MKLCLSVLLALSLPALAGAAPLKFFAADNNILCVRATEVSENFPAQFKAAAPTNQYASLVVDLRQAHGTNQTGVADFLASKKIPLAVLTDAQTQGAAAALAAQLHSAGAVVIGSNDTNPATAIVADIRVRLSTEEERKFLENPFTNAVTASALSGATNLMFYVDHTSEAELVRKSVKDGEEEDTQSPRATADQPVIKDPALARAVDLLKALAVLNRKRG